MRWTEEELTAVRPSPRQIRYQQRELIGFVHFTVNTFTDREWGDGTEDPAVFNPDRLDAGQWARTAREAGMRGLILTARHHDGFCLWPTKTTDHNISRSPFRGGHGDVVAECAEACRAYGLDFGIYLSPWDRHSPVYGEGEAYDDIYVRQLEELLTGYGDIFCVWMDGACGEGPNGRKQRYDWERYYAAVRRLQSQCCICICGEDVRWCGNEAGQTRRAEWSVVDAALRDAEKVAAKSQHEDSDAFRKKVSSSEEDLGSREALEKADKLCWYPCEVDTSIRPGWFYHASEDGQIRSGAELFDLYVQAVGGNSILLLNVPPDRHGLFAPGDVQALEDLGKRIRDMTAHELKGEVSASSFQPGCGPERAICADGFWAPEEKEGAWWALRFDGEQDIRTLVLSEEIAQGQRVEAYAVDLLRNGAWQEVLQGETVGWKAIHRLQTRAEGIRLRIQKSRGRVCVSGVHVYA